MRKKKKRMEQTKKGVRVDKKGEKERKKEEGKNRGGNEQESERGRERERENQKKGFPLLSKINKNRAVIFVGARGKVGPRNMGYAWIPKSWSFVKLHKVENFPTWNIYNLKVI